MSHVGRPNSHDGSSPQAGRIPEPPFSAVSLKYSALDNARQYQSHFGGSARIPSTSIVKTEGARPAGQDAIARRRNFSPEQEIIRGLLRIDAQRLVESSNYLLNLLQEGRTRKNLTRIFIAATCQVIIQFTLQTRHVRQKLDLTPPFWLSWIPYSMAGWYIIKYERGISCVNTVRDGAEHLCDVVEEGRPLNEADLDCFIGSEWEGAPWQEMESRGRKNHVT